MSAERCKISNGKWKVGREKSKEWKRLWGEEGDGNNGILTPLSSQFAGIIHSIIFFSFFHRMHTLYDLYYFSFFLLFFFSKKTLDPWHCQWPFDANFDFEQIYRTQARCCKTGLWKKYLHLFTDLTRSYGTNYTGWTGVTQKD